jgi:hypothetical protein
LAYNERRTQAADKEKTTTTTRGKLREPKQTKKQKQHPLFVCASSLSVLPTYREDVRSHLHGANVKHRHDALFGEHDGDRREICTQIQRDGVVGRTRLDARQAAIDHAARGAIGIGG